MKGLEQWVGVGAWGGGREGGRDGRRGSGGINELLSLGDITRDFPAVIDNHPTGPGPSFSLVHRRFLCVRSGINQKVRVRKTDIAASSPLPLGKRLIYCRCRRRPLASCKLIQMLPFYISSFCVETPK